MPPEAISYGEHPSQFCELFLPDGAGRLGGGRAGPYPVVVLIHGGFWRQRYGRDIQWPLAEDLRRRGWAAWNVEYRRVGGDGGWPATFDDVGAAIDALAEVDAPLDLSRVIAVGHSAGGHLALWAATRPALPAGAPGAAPRVPLSAAVSQAGAVDVDEVARLGLSNGAALEFLGGAPADVPEPYELGSPARRLPLGVPLMLLHGEQDEDVPVDISRSFAAAAQAAGDDCTLLVQPGGHFEHLDPDSAFHEALVTWMETQR